MEEFVNHHIRITGVCDLAERGHPARLWARRQARRPRSCHRPCGLIHGPLPHNTDLETGHAGRRRGITRGTTPRELARTGDTIFRKSAYTELG